MPRLILLAMLALLAACQTTPTKPTFSKQQVALLVAEGFKPVGENYELGIADKVLFEVDQSDLPPEAAAIVDRLAKALVGVGISGALVEGHTDSTGSDTYNQALSERRANTVKEALVKGGLSPSGMRAQGFGETDPIDSNDTEDGRAQNRRVVVVVTPLDAVPVGK
ncbi:OmpA family protein [Novosphingobium ginsenosidimutans]|uniref:OmpA family protein n=1 Tax=Novosphingobium ginsenosidimutans TaxID=1176536 RepID=A0A5B8S4A0_9SPHN|nr:OmpA family protein [Novosphingobium ginsenosidimutans]QEA16369.1 OmpA family protein [Novosphingobium ginsenosidimutans]